MCANVISLNFYFFFFFAVQQTFSCPAARFCLGCWHIQAISSLHVSYTKIVQLDTSPHFITSQKLHISCLYVNNTSCRYISLIKNMIQKKHTSSYWILRFSCLLLYFKSEKLFLRWKNRTNKNIWCPLKSRRLVPVVLTFIIVCDSSLVGKINHHDVC